MKEFMLNPNVSFIITIVSFVFGLIGAISAFFGIKSFFVQKKTNEAYEVLLNNAKMEWKGKYTEEEVIKLNSELRLLTEQISKEIPFQAKKVLLESKLENVEHELEKLYQEHKYLTRELEKIHPVKELDKNIRGYIEEEINTSSSKRRNILFGLILALAFIFFSSPVINRYFYVLLDEAIYITKAELYVEHITTYVMAMIAITGMALVIPMKKLNEFILYHKKLSVLIVFIMFVLWAILVYFISFNVLIVDYYGQLIAGIISLLIFAVAFKMLVNFFKNVK